MVSEKVHIGNRVFRAGTPYMASLAYVRPCGEGTVQQVPWGLCLMEIEGVSGNEAVLRVKASYPAPAVAAGTVVCVPPGKLKKTVGSGHFMEIASMLESAYGMPVPVKWEPPAAGRFSLDEVAAMMRVEVSSVKYYVDKTKVPSHSERRGKKTVVFLRHTAVAALHDACCPAEGYVRVPAACKLTGLSRVVLAKMADRGQLAFRNLSVSGAATYKVDDLMSIRRAAADYGPSIRDKRHGRRRRSRTVTFRVERGGTLGDLVDAMADAPEINNVLKGTVFKVKLYEDDIE